MDILLEALGDPAYRHVLLNHLPVTGLAFAALVLGWALYEGRWPTTVFALALVTLASGAAQPTMASGDTAYPFVFDALDGDGRLWLDHHAWLAERWGYGLLGNAGLAVVAIGVGHVREAARRPLAGLLLVTSLASLVAAVAIAEAGGKIRHDEFRLEDPPVHDEPGRLPPR